MINGPDIYTEDLSERPIATGDLFYPVKKFGEDNCGGVVLTPLCDLAQEKTQWVKLAKVVPLREYLAKEFIPAQLKCQPEFRAQIAENPVIFGNMFLDDKNSRVNKNILGLVKNLKKIIENTSPLKTSTTICREKTTRQRVISRIFRTFHLSPQTNWQTKPR